MSVAVTAVRLNPMRSPECLDHHLARDQSCSLSGSVATHGTKLKAVNALERDVRQRREQLGLQKSSGVQPPEPARRARSRDEYCARAVPWSHGGAPAVRGDQDCRAAPAASASSLPGVRMRDPREASFADSSDWCVLLRPCVLEDYQCGVVLP